MLWKCSSEFNFILYAANLYYIPGHRGIPADKPVAQRKVLVHNRDLGDMTMGTNQGKYLNIEMLNLQPN